MADEGKDLTGQESGLRTGGNMETRGDARVPASTPPNDVGTRTGGNMETKGASGGPTGNRPAGAPPEGASESPAGRKE